jgi:hypothetical protein
MVSRPGGSPVYPACPVYPQRTRIGRMPANGREPWRTSMYAGMLELWVLLPDRRTRADDEERRRTFKWCPGAELNHRHCDFQSHALPTELPGHFADHAARERRFIVRPGSPVHHASPSATPGAATRARREARPARPEGRRRAGDPPTAAKRTILTPIPRLPRRLWPPVWCRSSTASGSDRHPGSVRNKTAARPRLPACRRSGTVLRVACRGLHVPAA